jgi:nitrate reductase gamma subunit
MGGEGVSRGDVLLYAVLPYAAIVVFIVGHWWRYRRDQYGWGARSTQLLESRVLKYASVIFHLGVLAAIGGHVLGLLIPASWTHALGINDDAYHVIAVIGGMAAGVAVCVGFALLLYRRVAYPRVRVTTSRADVITFGLLALGIVTGLLATITNFGDAVHYRESVAPYFRNLLILNPQPELMTSGHVTFIFQLHVSVVWLLVAFWPFSRLVHAWSVPVDYLRRSPVVYRSRLGVGKSPSP